METRELQKAQEELSFIKSIIKDSREKLYDNGHYLILWGIVVFLGQFSNFLAIQFRFAQYLGYIWIGLVTIGWSGSFLMGRREKRENGTENFASKVASALWMGGGISMSIMGFAFGTINGYYINPTIAVILGVLYFTTGVLYEMKWLSRLGYGWWAVAILMFYWLCKENFLVYGIVIILFMVVPGIILNKNYKRVQKDNALKEV